MFRSAYGEMVLISYSVINIIYRRYCRNDFKRKLCLFYSCFTAYCLVELNTCRSSVGAWSLGSFELLFFWHKRAWWWRLECTASFCSCGWIETVVLKKQHCECRVDCKKCDRKKQQQGGLCGGRQKDCANPALRQAQ